MMEVWRWLPGVCRCDESGICLCDAGRACLRKVSSPVSAVPSCFIILHHPALNISICCVLWPVGVVTCFWVSCLKSVPVVVADTITTIEGFYLVLFIHCSVTYTELKKYLNGHTHTHAVSTCIIGAWWYIASYQEQASLVLDTGRFYSKRGAEAFLWNTRGQC